VKGHLTFLWLILVAVICFGLFLTKYETQSLEAELLALNKVVLHRQEELHVLKAEWALLSRPERIQLLSERHLHLQPVTAKWIDTRSELASRLEEGE